MTRVLGLDLSCTSTGVALPTGRTLALRPQASLSVAARLHWIAGAIARIARIYEPDVAVLEGYSLHSPGVLSTIRLAEVGGAVRLMLHERSVPYMEITPAQLKRYATGNGAAPKDRMVAAAFAAGGEPGNHDQADAWLLRALAIHGLDGEDLLAGSQPDRRKTRLEVVASIDWNPR